MNTKIVYALVSDDDDLYLQQALISIYSLKIHNPHAYICVVVDNQTYEGLTGNRATIRDLVNDIIVVECPCDYNKQQKSRQLKTSLRNNLDGDYLFIDTDTIIVDDISEIDNVITPIAAVKDKHLDLDTHPMKDNILAWAKLVGWEVDNKILSYYNSGVMYVKDTIETRNFYKTWNNNWIESHRKGLNLDQPSLGKTNQKEQLKISELDGSWNCQITDNGLKYLSDAKIIHYFASMQPWDTKDEISYLFRDKSILIGLKDNNNIISESLKKKILHAKGEFQEHCIILSGKNIDLMNTKLFHGIRKLYFKHPFFFRMINSFLNKMC